MLATMKLSMQADIASLHSAEKFGQLMAIFLWVYAGFSPFTGWVADHLNRKWLIVASLGVWSAVTLAMGYAHNFEQLYLLRGAMGISEAVYIPAALALISDYHQGGTRSLAVGIHATGIYMGQALGGVGGWIAQDVSWRAAFSWCGLVGVAYCLVLALLLKEKRGAALERDDRAERNIPMHWAGYAILLLCFALPSLAGWAVKNWLPTLLEDRFGLAQKSAGLWATLVTASASLLGVVGGGRLADMWARRNSRGRTRVAALGLFLLAPAAIGLGLAPGLALTLACAALFGLGFGMFDVNNMPILCQLAPPRFRATGYGIMNCFGIAAGAYLTPLLGHLKDAGVPLSYCFAVCSVPAVLAAGLMVGLGSVLHRERCGLRERDRTCRN